MKGHKFDKILDFLCSGIMSKKERENVRDELFDHLMCKYETYLAMGLDEESATEKSIKELGNKNELRENFQKVHWYYPAQSLKSAVHFMILANVLPGILFLTGLLPFTLIYMPVFCIVAVIVRLISAYMMRPANDKFRSAFVIEIITAFSIIGLVSFYPLDIFDVDAVLNVFIGTATVSFFASCVFNYFGLKELLLPYSDVKNLNKLNILLPSVSCLIIITSNLDSSSTFFAFSYVVYLLSFGISVCLFVNEMLKISDVLYKSDHEYKVEISVKKRYLICLVVIVFSFAMIGGVDYTVSKTKTVETPYSIDDCELNSQNYERICDNLISYGVPENYVELLPESEIVKYWNSVNKSDLTESASETYGSSVSGIDTIIKLETYSGSVLVRNYAIGLQESSNENSVRFLKIFTFHSDEEQEIKKIYNDCIVFDDSSLNEGKYTAPETTDNKGDFVIALRVTDDAIYEKNLEQLYLEPDDYKNYQHIKGIKFKPEPETIIIYATTRKLADINSTQAPLNFTYYHQNRAILFPIRRIEDLIKAQEYLKIERNDYAYLYAQESFMVHKTIDSYHHWVMPGYEYNLPKKSETEAKQNA